MQNKKQIDELEKTLKNIVNLLETLLLDNMEIAAQCDKPKTTDELLQIGMEQLNSFQTEVLAECFEKKYGGMSLPMGSGKTLISILLALKLLVSKIGEPALVVVSKSLISSWELEIKKFFGDSFPYQMVHTTCFKKGLDKWKIPKGTLLVLTTIDMVSKYYTEQHIDKEFITQQFINARGGGLYINTYNRPEVPYLNHVVGGGLFYSLKWGCLIIDEAQKYTNIETIRCKCLGAICTSHRWVLSGTLFNEPQAERILGYHILINAADKPRNLPDTKLLIRTPEFKGLNEHLVHRLKNEAFVPPQINQQIITHVLTKEEEKIYLMMKTLLIIIKRKADQAKILRHKEDFKKFSTYKLVLVLYLRQILICPLIPITGIIINTSDMEKKNELSGIIAGELRSLNIDHYLDDKHSIKSSRITKVLEILDKHAKEKVVVFSCFVSCLDILMYLLGESRPIHYLTGGINMKNQGKVIEDFRASDNGLLLTTYETAAEGLNLQFAATVLLVDYWWNAAKEQQAIARLFRFGQLAKQVNVYFFSANTGVEAIILKKQNAKLIMLEELKIGQTKTVIPGLRIDDIIKIIELEGNRQLLQQIYG